MRCASIAEYLRWTLWTLLLMCVFNASVDAKTAEFPCPGTDAIKWVRHPTDCSLYYICHYGQPLVMPRCPVGQIWGNTAKNCVPEGSRWDDCNGQKYLPPPKKSEVVVSTQKPFVMSTQKSLVTMRAQTTESHVTKYNIPNLPEKTQKYVTPGYTITGAVKFTVSVPRTTKVPERATKPPGKTSPFTPAPKQQRKRVRPTSTPKLFTTKSYTTKSDKRYNTRRPYRPTPRGSPFTSPRSFLFTTRPPVTRPPFQHQNVIRYTTKGTTPRMRTTRPWVRPTTKRRARPTMKPTTKPTPRTIRPTVRPTRRTFRPTRRTFRPTTRRTLRMTTLPTFRRRTTVKKTTVTQPTTRRTPFTPWPTRKSKSRYTSRPRAPTTQPPRVSRKTTRTWLRPTKKPGRISKLERLLKGRFQSLCHRWS